MSTTPLTDAIEALTRYANETTGASDTTLSDAVGTLVAGYGGGGGGGLTKLAEYTPNLVRGQQVDIDPTWFDTYDSVIIIPNLSFYQNGSPTSDWLRIAADNTSGSEYTGGSWASVGPEYSLYIWGIHGGNGYAYRWIANAAGQNANVKGSVVNNYLYYYAEAAAKTISGAITVYGIDY